MQIARPGFAPDPRLFGRGRERVTEAPAAKQGFSLGNEARLFATTFLAGFVFVSVLIA